MGYYSEGTQGGVGVDPSVTTEATSAVICPAGEWQGQTGQSSCDEADPGYHVPIGGTTTLQTICPAEHTSHNLDKQTVSTLILVTMYQVKALLPKCNVKQVHGKQ